MRKSILPTIFFLLGTAVLAYTVYYLSPYEAKGQINFRNLGLLLGSLLLSVATLSFFLLYLASFIWLRIVFKRSEAKPVSKLFLKSSLRRGLLVGLFVLIFALFALTRTSSFFNISLLILIFVLIETYFWK